MIGYSPKRGDKIRLSYEGYVTSIDVPVIRLGVRTFSVSGASIELVTPAPVPFEVGKPLTKEMGEPPNSSYVIDGVGMVWQRRGDQWSRAIDPMTKSWNWLFNSPHWMQPLTLGGLA